MANQWYKLLSKDQRDSTYRNRKKQLGKYFALWCESGHLNQFMVTLSPSTNTLKATISLRKNFFKQLNNLKHYHGFNVAYYSAVEIGLNKNPPTYPAQMTEKMRMKLKQKNFHIHIQLHTDMKESDLQTIISRMNGNLFYFSKISAPKIKGIKYDYVVKDIKTIDWKLQYILKTQYKGKILYSSSRKSIADYMITKLWDFMKTQYKDKWNNIGDKYSFVLNLKKNGDLLLSSTNKTGNIGSNLSGINLNLYDVIHIKDKGIYIYVKKNVL